MPAVTSRTTTLLTAAAFVAVSGSFGAGLLVSLHHPAPATIVTKPVEAPPEDLMQVYYRVPEDIFIMHPDHTSVIASVTVLLEGSPAALLQVQEAAKASPLELQAALLDAAQVQAEISADVPAYRADLPAALMARMNSVLGEAGLPAPVKEVLLIKFLTR